MPSDPVSFALRTPGHLRFSTTRALADDGERAGIRVEASSSGHLVFYRLDGRRFLATDPAGHPLHECEWEADSRGRIFLRRARLRLDCGRWIGLRPNGLIHETSIHLAAKPGWRTVTPDGLRSMAAQSLHLPIDEVRWFFRDEDIAIDEHGVARIRHRKDALYLLENGEFEQGRFMSCMGAMDWDHIDFLPVVELFKSLMPGTGSATFELIRGLYDDQNQGALVPQVLRYRGIPTYPSEAAYRLFSNFFRPHAPGSREPQHLFMDPSQSHVVTWLPVEHPPVRYVDDQHGLCLTVQNEMVQKATLARDSAGVPYVTPNDRFVPLDRSVDMCGQQVTLRDRTEETVLNTNVQWSASSASRAAVSVSPVDWRAVFGRSLPAISAREAYEAVLFYPEDDEEIGEASAQPFVADYLQDLSEHDREITTIMSRAERVLIDNGDAVVATCIPFDRPRDYVVSCHHAAYVQRQAQQLWLQCAQIRQWDWLKRVSVVPTAAWDETIATHAPYDLGYLWIPYHAFAAPADMAEMVARLRMVLRSNATAFVVGPADLRKVLTGVRMSVCWEELVETLPTFRMHRTILPKARLKQGLTVFCVRRP